VQVVYEDQGPPFWMEPGDCVLQPPGIRHRVLEASPALEVVEVGCPAEHETLVDPHLALPTVPSETPPARTWNGQRFVWSRAADRTWAPWHTPGFDAADTGISDATSGLVGVRLVRPAAATAPSACEPHSGELRLWFVRSGAVALAHDAGVAQLGPGDSAAVPAGRPHALRDPSPDLELLEVSVP
jgi:mannose-6-phosphate isomerase-like protein (cupin superfamily)